MGEGQEGMEGAIAMVIDRSVAAGDGGGGQT